MKSRVNREVQARFCEGLGVKFPGATRPSAIANRRQTGENLPMCNRCNSTISCMFRQQRLEDSRGYAAGGLMSTSVGIFRRFGENNRDRQDRTIRSMPKADGTDGAIHLVENELVAFQVDRLGLGKNFDRGAQHDSRYRLRWRENGE